MLWEVHGVALGQGQTRSQQTQVPREEGPTQDSNWSAQAPVASGAGLEHITHIRGLLGP